MGKRERELLSIVTPTYNRAELLERCYRSLVEQTCYDFEWIIVDDGSKDNTKEVVQSFIERNNTFPITYVWKENGGKHTALNASHLYIHGEYILILDSDDRLTPDAVETVLEEWGTYKKNTEIGILTFYRQNDKGEIFAYSSSERKIVDIVRHKRVCVHSSDCCEVIRTELFKKYPFPVFENERFLAETALWNRVALECKCLYPGKGIYIGEYLEGGLSDSGRMMRLKNPLGGMYTSHLRMHKKCFMAERIKATLLYICYGKCAGKSIIDILKEGKPYQALIGVLYLPGLFMYLSWRKKYGTN